VLGAISAKRLTLVHPVLGDKILTLSNQTSFPFGVTQGLRTYAEQHALFAQGRLSLMDVNQLRQDVGWALIDLEQNVVVTNADEGLSWHNFGLAVDLVPYELDGEADWNSSHPCWAELIEKGTELGLTNGKSWKDEPHFELVGRFAVGAPDDEVRSLFTSGGLTAVWEASGIS